MGSRNINGRNKNGLFSSHRRTQSSQAPPVVVGEPDALVAQARLQNPVLFAQFWMTSCCSCWSQPTRNVTSR
jgi:hypothetical protein